MLLQVLLHGLYFIGGRRAKTSTVVDIDDISILEMDNHIGAMVAVDIHETECHRDELLAVPVELWADIDARFRGIAARKFNHLDATVEIQRDKVAGIARRVVMPDHRIDLKRARAPVMNVIPGGVPPVDGQRQQRPQHQHDDHADAQ